MGVEYTESIHTAEACSSVTQWHTCRARQHCMQQCTTAQYAAIHTVVDSSKFNCAQSNHAQCTIVITQCILLVERATWHSIVHTVDSSTNTAALYMQEYVCNTIHYTHR